MWSFRRVVDQWSRRILGFRKGFREFAERVVWVDVGP